MLYTEELMVLLYNQAAKYGNEEKQIEALAEGNDISAEEVIDILERNGVEVMSDKKEPVVVKKNVPTKLRELAMAEIERLDKEIAEYTEKLTQLETDKEELQDFLAG